MLEDLDVVFVDSQMVNLKSYEIDMFQKSIKKSKEKKELKR